jgi:predicted alpha/beta-fold hydrolase
MEVRAAVCSTYAMRGADTGPWLTYDPSSDFSRYSADAVIEPPFKSLPLLSGGHRQTLMAYLIRGKRKPYQAVQHVFDVDETDQTILHDDCPPGWAPADPVALMMHGLAGCHGSDYMVRIAGKLNDRGVRTFRMDHRDCGAAVGRSRRPYHSGISQDLLAAWQTVLSLCPESPGAVLGFSLSANIVVNTAGSCGWTLDDPTAPRCVIAVNPPIDLAQCSQALGRRDNRVYEKHFVNLLVQTVERRMLKFPSAPKPLWKRPPRTLREFDDLYTAPASGFSGVSDYYARCSGNQFIESIRIPTLILTAEDDPMVPPDPFRELPNVAGVTVHIAPSGGHLGYLGCKAGDPDRRWMDWRVIEWLMPIIGANPAPNSVQHV